MPSKPDNFVNLYLNPYIFLLINEGNVIVWDYKNHVQLELEEPYLKRLIQISNGLKVAALSEIDNELLREKLIQTEAYPAFNWKWDELSKIYHIGTQDIDGGKSLGEEAWVEWYLELCETIKDNFQANFMEYTGDEISLPAPNLSTLQTISLWDAEEQRMTSRSFNGESITKEQLSTLMYASFGVIHGNWKELQAKGFKQSGYRKSSPSGGALHPIEAYIIVMNVEEIPAGIYHYNVIKHCLTLINHSISYDDIRNMLCGQFFAEGCSVGIFLVAHFEKVWTKYCHSRSYKDVYLDAGHLSQTLLLNSTALGLRTWISAWFRDSEVSKYLNISGEDVAPVFYVSIGHGDKVAISPKLEEILRKINIK